MFPNLKKHYQVAVFCTAAFFLFRPSLWMGAYPIEIQFATAGILAVLAFGLVLLSPDSFTGLIKAIPFPEKIFWIILAAIAFYFESGSFFENPGSNLIYILIPFFAAVYRTELIKLLPGGMTFLFFWNWGLSFLMLIFQKDHAPFGIAGNWNWSAVLMIMTLPFVILFFNRFQGKKKLFSFIPLLMTLGILPFLRSRAAWLVLGLYLLLWVLFKFREKTFAILCSVIFCAALISAILFIRFSDCVIAFCSEEIRFILFDCGLRFIQLHPFGTGAASYENIFSALRDFAYFTNPYAAVRSTHPHNEILYLSGIFGIPGLIAIIALYISGFIRFFKKGAEKPEEQTLFSVLVIGLFYAQLDLAFHAWPLNVIILLLSGFFLFPEYKRSEEKSMLIKLCGGFLSLFALILIIFTGYGTLHAELSKKAYRKNEIVSGLRHAEKATPFLAPFPELLYKQIIRAYQAKQFAPAMKMTEQLQSTHNPDFLRIHFLKANIAASLGNDQEAVNEYRKELKRYPHLVLPIIGIINACGRMGNMKEVEKYKSYLSEQLKRRGIDQNGLRQIMRNPNKDLRPLS